MEILDRMNRDLLVENMICMAFSPWQRLNRVKSQDSYKYSCRRMDAIEHLQFVRALYKKQI